MNYPQEKLPNVIMEGEVLISITTGAKVKSERYASDEEVVELARSGKYRELDYLTVYSGATGNMIAPVPFDHMTDDEKLLYESQRIRYGEHKDKTIKEYWETFEPDNPVRDA
jgi:hypothetical protein